MFCLGGGERYGMILCKLSQHTHSRPAHTPQNKNKQVGAVDQLNAALAAVDTATAATPTGKGKGKKASPVSAAAAAAASAALPSPPPPTPGGSTAAAAAGATGAWPLAHKTRTVKDFRWEKVSDPDRVVVSPDGRCVWIGGWVGGWMDVGIGWTVGWVDGWLDGWIGMERRKECI